MLFFAFLVIKGYLQIYRLTGQAGQETLARGLDSTGVSGQTWPTPLINAVLHL